VSYKAIAFKRAAQSVRDYPIKIRSGREAEALRFVGKDTGRKIQGILDREARGLSGSPQAPRDGAPGGAPAPAAQPAKRGGADADAPPPKKARSQVKLKDLIAAGLLTVGGTVQCSSGGVRFEGSVEPSGAVRFQGTDYNNPTAFAKAAHAAAGKPESKPDGWTAVSYNGRPLKELRALAESAPAGGVGAAGAARGAGGAGGDDVENVLPRANAPHNTINSSIATSLPHAPGAHAGHKTPAAAAAAAATARAAAAAASSSVPHVSSVPASTGGVRYPKVGSAGYALMVGLYRMYHGIGVACQQQVCVCLIARENILSQENTFYNTWMYHGIGVACQQQVCRTNYLQSKKKICFLYKELSNFHRRRLSAGVYVYFTCVSV
jgi:hypothetical protein